MKSTIMKVMMDIFFFVSKTGIYPDNPSKQINILLSTHRPPHWDFSVPMETDSEIHVVNQHQIIEHIN